MAENDVDNMSCLINKPFLIKMLQKNTEQFFFFVFFYSDHHEMAVLPSQPKHHTNIQCSLDWNMHASYIEKKTDTATQEHSCSVELQNLLVCDMKLSSLSLFVRCDETVKRKQGM